MNANYWNDKVDWLKAVRAGWFNEDYIQFLVEKVWKIPKPVNVIDFGCGFGYVGLILLPLLPKGSTYTGIDISDNLINEAENIFKNTEYMTTFIKEDLNNYVPESRYDIAISQAVLRHIPNAKSILNKMIESIVSGGLVICMETDLELEKAGQYFSGLDYTELGIVPLMRKLWKKELADGGRDYRFAVKIPSLMQELGLNNIGIRMSDSVYFINPYGNKSEYTKQYEVLAAAWGWNKQLTKEDEQVHINSLIDKGLTQQEAEIYVRSEQKIREHMVNNKDNVSIIRVPCTLISFGTKE